MMLLQHMHHHHHYYYYYYYSATPSGGKCPTAHVARPSRRADRCTAGVRAYSPGAETWACPNERASGRANFFQHDDLVVPARVSPQTLDPILRIARA